MSESTEAPPQITTDNATSPANSNVIDITGDGGVVKEIKREGTGDDHPAKGDKVIVHYVGTLTDGTKFDSSRDRNSEFDFQLGKGKVIKAWDMGVATMRRGELAVFTCQSQYAYGDAGSPPKIPPGATLMFEVELIDWKGEDLSDRHDGGVIRSQIEEGDGFSSPNDGATVDIHLVGKHGDRIFEDRDVQFVVGEGMEDGVVDGVDHAMRKFKKGEKSRLFVNARYAYGAEGKAEFEIPSDTDLVYEVHLKKFEKAQEVWEMSNDEKLDQADLTKTKGTNFFKGGKYKLAAKYYQKIVEILDGDTFTEEDLKTKRKTLLLAAHLNKAQCYLKLGNHFEARNSCEKALELDPKNEKGLFRRGQAKLELQDFHDAVKDFEAVLAGDPVNAAAKRQLAIAKQKIKVIVDKEKKTYGGMFQKFAAQDSKKTVKTDKPETKEEATGEAAENGKQSSDPPKSDE